MGSERTASLARTVRSDAPRTAKPAHIVAASPTRTPQRSLGNRSVALSQGSKSSAPSRSARVATTESPANAQLEAHADEVASALLHEHAPPDLAAREASSGTSRSSAPSVAATLSQNGEPLPPAEQLSWGRLLQRDLSTIRIHREQSSALDIGARAYAMGTHLAFAPGEYRAGSMSSRHLLAHEVAHAALHGGEFIRRTPGAGVDHVEVDCDHNEIIFFQERSAYRYLLTACSDTLLAGEYTANVNVADNQLPFIGGSFEFELDNDAGQGNPFLLFGAQTSVRVVVWTGTASAVVTEDTDTEGGTTETGTGATDRETGGGGESPRIDTPTEPGRGLRISSLATDAQRELVLRVLRSIHGEYREGDAPVLDTFITMADIDALRRLEAHPQRAEILALLRLGHGGTESYDYANVLDAAIANVELQHYGDQFDYRFATTADAGAPLVSRPVHGRIEALSGNLVPGKEGVYEFIVQDAVDLFAVPHVFIRWFASRVPTGDERPEIIDRETVNYIELNPEGWLTDRRFEVTFDEVGDYEIHAFVLHSFFMPAHFMWPVTVATEEDRLREMEAAEESSFGTVESAAGDYAFNDVATEDTIVRIGLVAYGVAPINLIFADDPDAVGVRRTGALSAARRDPAAAVAYIEEQRTRVTALRDRYAAAEQADLLAWANERLAQLNALHGEVTASFTGADNHGVAVDGYYIGRDAGGEGRLRLASWFTYDAANSEYHAVLIDYSQMVRNRNFRFEESGTDLNAVYERLFFLLSSTYPSGRMRFSYQQYDALTASTRFVQFERNTDTLLNDLQEVAFSTPVSTVVNVAAAILTVFPPTMAVGIGISLAYNGADAALGMLDANRSGTVSASNYVDLAMVAVDIVPLAGRAMRLGETGLRVLRVGSELAELAGNFYVFTDRAFEQIDELRTGDVQRLADLQTEINTLLANHAPAEEIARRRDAERRLVGDIRARTEEVFLNNAATMGLQIVSQAGARRLASSIAGRYGVTTVADVEASEAARRADMDETMRRLDESIAERPREEIAEGDLIQRATGDAARRPEIETDPILATGLPEGLRSAVPVLRTEGEHGSVRVRAEASLFGVGRIWIEAGRLASAADIADHVAAVRLLQQYQGFTGSLRAAMEYATGLISGLPPDAVRRGRELRGEIEKLPPIIQRYAAELEASRHALSAEEIAAHEARIRDLESQLDGHRTALAGLNAESQSVGYIAALDRLTEGMDRDISASLPPQHMPGARARLEFARQILNRVMRRAAGLTSDTDATLPAATEARLRGILREMVMDPVFGQLALEELQRRTRAGVTDPVVRRRGGTTPLADELARAWPHFDAVDAERRARHASEDVTRDAVIAHRARSDVPDVTAEDSGTVAAGILLVEGASGLERVGDVMLGTSRYAETLDVAVDPRYRKRRASGVVETDPRAIDHGEQTVLGRAARELETRLSGADPATIGGELRMHVEGPPCFNCLAGLSGDQIVPGRREYVSSGPFLQFSREFPGVRILATFDGPPSGVMVIRNGVIESGDITAAEGSGH